MERPTYLTRRRWNEWSGAEIIPEKKLDIDKCAICLEIINFHRVIFSNTVSGYDERFF